MLRNTLGLVGLVLLAACRLPASLPRAPAALYLSVVTGLPCACPSRRGPCGPGPCATAAGCILAVRGCFAAA